MRATAIDEFGGPERLLPGDPPRPEPSRGELPIRMVSAGVRPVDRKIREGGLAGSQKTYSLAEAAAAQRENAEGRVRGKLVFDP